MGKPGFGGLPVRTPHGQVQSDWPMPPYTCPAGGRLALRILVAIPVYNEQKYVESVLEKVLAIVPRGTRVLVVDDGSTDTTPLLLARYPVEVVRHAENRGYGRSMQDAFRWGMCEKADWVITMDCDEQHEPAAIPRFIEAMERDDADVISGSRYMADANGDAPPPDRRAINAQITAELNERLGLALTDSFCGFKAYRVAGLRRLSLDVDGYAFPMQFWVQAVAQGLRITELPVKLIYKDLKRSFGGHLDDPGVRLAHYRCILHRELRRCAGLLPLRALSQVDTAPCAACD